MLIEEGLVAGGYAIQGLLQICEKNKGSYTNVVGLSLVIFIKC